MPAITVPKTSVQYGPGYLYRAPLGSLLPGQTAPATVSNKALTSNVVTLATAAAHGLAVGQLVTVALSPADPIFDGTYMVASVPTSTTFTYAKTNANVTGTASGGTVAGAAGGIVAGSVFVDAWPAAWIPWGVTREGSQFNYQINTSPVEVAEYLPPLAYVEDGVAIGVEFDVVEVTARNFAYAINAGAGGVTTVGGSGATQLSKLSPPAVGQSVRQMIGWESNDGTERAFYYQCLQSGSLAVARRKGANPASLPMTFAVEQPATGDAFNNYYAGTVRVGS